LFFIRIVIPIRVIGRDNVPNTGRLVIMSNHHTNLDPFLVASTTKRHIIFLAKRELFQNWLSKALFEGIGCIPVNRDGNDLLGMKKALDALNKEKALGVFPEGRRVHENSHDFQFKSGGTLLAYRTSSPVLPMYIYGSYKLFHRMTVIVGKPFALQKKDKKLTAAEYQQLTDEEVVPRIEELKEMAALSA